MVKSAEGKVVKGRVQEKSGSSLQLSSSSRVKQTAIVCDDTCRVLPNREVQAFLIPGIFLMIYHFSKEYLGEWPKLLVLQFSRNVTHRVAQNPRYTKVSIHHKLHCLQKLYVWTKVSGIQRHSYQAGYSESYLPEVSQGGPVLYLESVGFEYPKLLTTQLNL